MKIIEPDQILSANKEDHYADTTTLENMLTRKGEHPGSPLHYDLTPDEIAIVEGKG